MLKRKDDIIQMKDREIEEQKNLAKQLVEQKQIEQKHFRVNKNMSIEPLDDIKKKIASLDNNDIATKTKFLKFEVHLNCGTFSNFSYFETKRVKQRR